MQPRWIEELDAAAALRRRELLELLAAIAAVAVAGCKGDKTPEPTPPPTPSPPPAPRALEPAAYRAIEALADRILPADGDFPGARAAGAIDFIDRQLAIEPIAKLAPAVNALGVALDGAAKARGGRDFATLPAGVQDGLVEALATGKLGSGLPEAPLFRALHGLVLEGFLGDPNHGGNRDQIGWRAVGFREPLLRVRGGAPHGHGSSG
jgi:gluconate 2-dehydrogenase gamma chain